MAAARRTRILIVDDSAVMRSLLRSVVCTDAGLEVAGTAADGATALNSLEQVRPDLILLDVEMPVKDGLATLRELRIRARKTPVIMCSSLTQRGAKVTIEALACGAADYVSKPTGQANREQALRALAQDLIPKIRALTDTPATSSAALPRGLLPLQTQPALLVRSRSLPILPPVLAAAPQLGPVAANWSPAVVAIGVSTGGPAALDVLLPSLPGHFPLPLLVVQHMPELFTRLLAERLNGRCNLHVREAAEGEPVLAGSIYIARGNWHLECLAGSHSGAPPTLRLNQGPLENHCRPAVDVLFRSLAKTYGAGVLAVVLTGMGSDGTIGCRLVRQQGGAVLAQDQASSAVWGMPGAVCGAGLANKVLPLDAIAGEMVRLAARNRKELALPARESNRQVVE